MSIRAKLDRLERQQRQTSGADWQGPLSNEERQARLDELLTRARRGDPDAQQRLEQLRDLEQRVRAAGTAREEGMSIRQRLARLEQQRRCRGPALARPLTDEEWGETFEHYRSELAPRDQAFAAAVAAHHQAVAQARAQCLPDDPRRRELWPHFPAVADAWECCAGLAERLLETTRRKGDA